MPVLPDFAVSRRTALAALLSPALPTLAQPKGSTLRLVAPFQPGGGSDVLARALVKHLAPALGQTIIVDNKPGGGGAIGGQDVARSPGDGNTLLFGSSTALSGVAALNKRPAYDPSAAFSGITLLGYYTAYVFVNAELPVRTLSELIRYAAAHPGEVRCATGHATARIACAQLSLMGKVQMTEVPYKGEVAVMQDLITNRVQLTFAAPVSLMPYVTSGKLRVIGTLLPQRSKYLPDVPTMAEAGLPGFISAGWAALVAPKPMALPMRERLAKAVAGVVGAPEVLEAAEQTQFVLKTTSPSEMDEFMRADVETWKRVVRDARIELE